jgi:tetratricopeptide (TPR) repeat protein
MDPILNRTAVRLREWLSRIRCDRRVMLAPQASIVLAQVLSWQAHHRFRNGSTEGALALLEESLTLVGDAPPSPQQKKARALTRLMLGWILGAVARDRCRADQLLRQVLDEAAELGDEWSRLFGLWVLGLKSHGSGQYPRAEGYLQEGLAHAIRVGDRYSELWFLEGLARVLWTMGDYSKAERLAGESYRLSLLMGERVGVSASLLRLGEITAAQGNYQQAEAYLQSTIANAREMSDLQMQAESLLGLGVIALLQDNPGEAKRFLDEALSLIGVIPPWSKLGVLVESAYAALAMGNAERCEEFLREALRLALDTGMVPRALDALLGIAHLSAHQGDPVTATEYLALVLHHPAVPQVTRYRAAQLQARLEREMPPDAFTASIARGQARELESTVVGLLEAN